jgi:O-ureido-D-serine cyclo-ligase
MPIAAAHSVALVTTRAARTLDADLPLLAAALTERNVRPVVVDWDDAELDWSRFDLAVLRSTWDYSARWPEFLGWLERTATLTRLVNPPEAIRWSLDKHYLAALQRAGVPTAPTVFAEPNEEADQIVGTFLRKHGADELVVKPAIGSGARGAQRFARTAQAGLRRHVARMLAEGCSVLLQPYLERVDVHGETALIYINGHFSHAIGKGAVLPRGHAPMETLFAPEAITPRTARADELALGAQVLACLPFAMPLYARIDLLHDANAAPCVLELELAEPSLYLEYSPQAPARLADALAAVLVSQ